MIPFYPRAVTALSATLLCASCVQLQPQPDDAIRDTQAQERLAVSDYRHNSPANLRVSDEPYVPSKPSSVARHEWLRQIVVSIDEPEAGSIPVGQMIRKFRANGINITSQLPLDSYYYNGYGVDRVDAVTALNLVLGSVGLDFKVNDRQRYVEVQPLRARSWALNVTNREVSFAQESETSSGDSEGGSSSQALQGVSSGGSDSTSSAKQTVKTNVSFWADLAKEVEARLTYLIPTAPPPPLGGFQAPGREGIGAAVQLGGVQLAAQAGGQTTDLFREQRIGRVSINPATGYVTVQAPSFLLDEIEDYLQKLQLAFNARLEFEGRFLLVNSSQENSYGLDIAAFREDFSKTFGGLVFSNNALGGLTFSLPQGGNPLSVEQTNAFGSVALGTTRPDGLLNIFSAYLERFGTVHTIQKPYLVTSNGVPAVFAQENKTYVNIVSEATSTTQAGATTARENQLIPFTFGTSLRINPTYDPDKDVIRAQISLSQTFQNGTVTIQQFVTGASGATAIPVDIPLDSRVEYSGEAVMRNNSMIVLGGQVLDHSTFTRSGVPGTAGSLVEPVTGRSGTSEEISTYYFALSARALPSYQQ